MRKKPNYINKILKKYCKDDYTKIENFALAQQDNFDGWVCHHRLELTINNEYAHSAKELKRLGMYYDRPYYELILMRKKEHKRLHAKHRSPETKKKVKEKMKNKKFKNGKTTVEIKREQRQKNMSNSRTFTNETKKKMSASAKRRCPTRGNKGMHWYNNGKENILCTKQPIGYVRGRLTF